MTDAYRGRPAPLAADVVQRVAHARAMALTDVVDDVAKALKGQMGNRDATHLFFVNKYSRTMAQAIMHILGEIKSYQDDTEQQARTEISKRG